MKSKSKSFSVRAIQMTDFDIDTPSLKLEEIENAAIHDQQYISLARAIQNGFPADKKALDPLISEYWKIRNELLVSDDGFIMYTLE